MNIIKETEKAVQVKVVVDAEYAPIGGYTSSLVKGRTFTTTAWLPKSQMVDGNFPEWLLKTKAAEIADSHSPLNMRTISTKLYIVD